MNELKLIAFDLDGTLCQHKSPLPPENIEALNKLGKHYKLLMVGAGQCGRIFRQMEGYPIDIIGNYGLQYAECCKETGALEMKRDLYFPCDVASVEKRVTYLRQKYGYTTFAGNSVEYHPSGCITFAILGTEAVQADKLAFDPDRKKRRIMYEEVASLFPEYCVFIGGASSFDMAPAPYNKYHALDLYCKEHGLAHEEVVFVGDDYTPGGNDASVYDSDFAFIPVDDYREFPRRVAHLLEGIYEK